MLCGTADSFVSSSVMSPAGAESAVSANASWPLGSAATSSVVAPPPEAVVSVPAVSVWTGVAGVVSVAAGAEVAAGSP
jgi:hypothetical protein